MLKIKLEIVLRTKHATKKRFKDEIVNIGIVQGLAELIILTITRKV